MNEERKKKAQLSSAYLLKQRDLCEKSFYNFFKMAWVKVLEPSTKFIDNWHIHYLCWILQEETNRVSRGEEKKHDIIINISPRSLKSRIVSTAWNAWVWGPAHLPQMKFLTASYDDGLASDHAVATRDIIKSEWYQRLWGDIFQLSGDQQLKTFFSNNKTGRRVSTSVGGEGTGFGGTFLICDDPLSATQAESEVFRQRAITWWNRTIYSRLDDPKVGLKIIIAQRLHEDDLCGHELATNPDRYLHICIPAEDKGNIKPAHLSKNYINGLMFPKRLSRAFLDEARKNDVYAYAGQHDQNPAPAEGGMFKRRYWKFWQFRGDNHKPVVVKDEDKYIELPTVEIPDLFDEIINSWDMAFKETKKTDYVVGQAWGRKNVDKYLLMQSRARMDFIKSVDSVRELKKKTGLVSAIIIEEKANGAAVISQLKREVAGLIPFTSSDSKQARASMASRQQASGNIILPHPEIFPWVWDFIKECGDFPVGKNDDMVDAFSQSCIFLSDEHHQVVGSYKWNDPRHRGAFELSEQMTYTQHSVSFGAVVQQQDLSLAHVFAAWDVVAGRLWVYDELLLPNAIPALAVMQIREIMARQRTGMEKFIAHPDMFSNEPQLRTIVNQFKKHGLRPREPIKYDENGSIAMMLQMFAIGRITLHNRCEETDKQLREWVVNNGRPTSKNIGLPIALCLIVSELERRYRIFAPESKLNSYQRKPEDMPVMANKDKWQAM